MNNNYIQEISIKEITKIINKKKKNIFFLFIIIVFLISSFLYIPYFQKEKTYEAISSMSLIYDYKSTEKPQETTEGYVLYQDRMNGNIIPTIQGYAESVTLLRDIISELDIKNSKGKLIKAKDLSKKIKVENKYGTNFITISVEYKNKELASQIANKIPQKLIQIAASNPNFKDCKIKIIDYAVAEETKNSSKFLILVVGMLLALVIGILLPLLQIFWNKKIQFKSKINSLGLDIESNFISLDEDKLINRIVSISRLSAANNIVIASENELELLTKKSSMNTNATDNNLNIDLISYRDDNFLFKLKEYDKIFIIVQENVSTTSYLEEIAFLMTKYGLNVSIMYIED